MKWVLLLFLGSPPVAQEHRFLDKPNIGLFSTEIAVRGLDAYSTRRATW